MSKNKTTKSKDLKMVPKVKVARGRPSIDWPLLFGRWVKSGLPKKEFLAEYGLKHTNGNVVRATKNWELEAQAMNHGLTEQAIHPEVIEERAPTLWETIQFWRKGQAKTDYEMADAVRTHIKLLLNQSVVKDENGKPHTELSAVNIKNISEALFNLQRIQRLSLGMSTDNIGLGEVENDTNIEAGDEQFEGPVFVVEVAESGKFRRARPKQIA